MSDFYSKITENLLFDRNFIWHPYAGLKDSPERFLVKSARKTTIETADGLKLIDAISSWWCMAHGHNAPEIVEAITSQINRFCHVMFAGFTHEQAILLAEKLTRFLPSPLNKIFFADSGSIAVECAVKMAIQYQNALGYPEKKKLIALKGGYHGDTACAMSLSDPDGMHVLFRGIMAEHFFAERPNSRFDGEFLEEDLSSVEKIMDLHEKEIAAVICEPIFQGGNGMWMYHPKYLRALRKLCDERNILLIFDEIATGFFRTGKRFAFLHAEVLPDLICIGKALTGGALSLAATIASEKVAETISSGNPSAFMHGPTFMANPIACSAALASLELFEKRNYEEKVLRIENRLKKNLKPFAELKNVSDVRVLGAIGVLELSGKPDEESVLSIIKETGVWLRPFSNYVYTMPPFISTDEEIDKISEAMRRVAETKMHVLTPGEFHE